MNRGTRLMIVALFSILFSASTALVQETEHQEHGESLAHEEHQQEHAEPADHEEHGEEHGGRSHHKNEFAVFLGATDELGHPTEFTWGLDYKRRVADRWAVGGLFDYAGGELRNAVLAASVTWFPVGHLQLMAAPGVEFHDGRSSGEGCGCAGSTQSDDIGTHSESDKDATYFLFRLGVAWDFQIGKGYGIVPQVNLDLVNNKEVWVYGLNFTYAW